MNNKKTYFISGGGTGGHIYPAFTVVEKLLKEEDTDKVYFIGNPKNLEFDIAKHYENVTFLPVDVTGMPRKLSFSFIKWGLQLIFAYIKALKYIKKHKPNCVFTTGGYVSAPIVLASMSTKTPYMIHDCDSIPGLVSKMAAPKANIVSIAFENSKKILKSKNIIFNGNPVREAFFTITKEDARKTLNIAENKCIIFAMGGSQGAKTINTAMINILEKLSKNENNYIILQTGKNKFDETVEELEKIYPEYKNNPNILVRPYFDDMVYPLKACDIVISRAGSVSLSEILQCGTPSILIPYPFAAQDHQRKNAKEMVERGTSLYIEDNECTGDTLLSALNDILSNKNKLFNMSEAAKNFAKNNPTQKIVNQLKSIIK
ncbi:undecaprenyldiphospho-muramoylpentapeptide beta-N-acetylglucosaminyltransferase [bacterium]|nr:undecaprenyldiphospho-muramoylpentapeptide beta-N-acetylglucosaminyltransferase [bacterium]